MHQKIFAMIALVAFHVTTFASTGYTTFTCSTMGCHVRCVAPNTTLVDERAAVQVILVNHSNGNIEIQLNDGTRGNRTHQIAKKETMCTVNDYAGQISNSLP